ncbi:hypothetical protein [Idiomarina xiamenensis]|nr:hypothetical protein [Idiomarina xiamenensis]
MRAVVEKELLHYDILYSLERAGLLDDYRLDNYHEMLSDLILKLPTIIADKSFQSEMQRFLPTTVFERTLANEKFQIYLKSTLSGLFNDVADKLYRTNDELEFRM